jgi:putative ABC transport system permease protein
MERRSWQRALRIGRADVAADVQTEVEFHLQTQVDELVAAGWPRERAREEALRRFGDLQGVRHELIRIGNRREGAMRRTQVFEDVGQDVRLALRQLRQRPFFALIAVTILALGIGANAAVFGVVDGMLLRPLPFPEGERLVYLQDVQDEESGLPASLPEFDDWQRVADFVSSATSLATNGFTLLGEGAPELVYGGVLRGDPVRTLRLRAVHGRVFSDQEMRDAARVLMLAESYWQERFGGADVIGRSVRLNDDSYAVIGVLPDEIGVLRSFNPPSFWLPMQRHERMTRGLHFLQVIGRLADGVTMEQARERAKVVSARLRETGETMHGISLTPLREVLVGDVRDVLFILLGAVLFVLLIVCANLANLFVSQSLDRGREFGVRVALGAGRFRLVRQIVTESIVVGLIGGIAGLAVAYAIGDTIASVSTAAGMLAPASVVDQRVLAYTFAVAVLVAVTFGLWPAWRAAHADAQLTLKEAGDTRTFGGRAAWRRRRALVAAELALSVVLLAGAGLLVRSTRNLLDVELGFQPANVLTFDVSIRSQRYESNYERARFYAQLLERLRAIPGVRRAAATSHVPLTGGDTNGGFEIVGRDYPEGEGPNSRKREASPDYFVTLGIPVLQGRVFTEHDRAGSPDVVVISQALVERYWPGENPIGRRIRHNWGPGEEQEIIGVVGDVRHDGLDLPVGGTVYRPLYQFAQPATSIVLKTNGDTPGIIAGVRRELAALDPSLPIIGVSTLERAIANSVGPRRTMMLLLSGFAAVALLLAAVGVYAVTAQAVAQRRREFGVRMALGARAADVLRMILQQELAVILIGLGAGLLGAYAATRVLRASLFQVSATDPLTFGVAATVLVLIGLLATWIPARVATRTDPALALRAE